MARELQTFLRELEAAGELRRVRDVVSPLLDISFAAHEESRRPAPSASTAAEAFDPGRGGLGGQALLFEQVEGCDFPVAINVFGSYRRMEMALGTTFTDVADRVGAIAMPTPPSGLGDLLRTARTFMPILRAPPRTVRRAACQDVVRTVERGEVDLRRLPLIKCWPLDGDPAAVGYPGIDA